MFIEQDNYVEYYHDIFESLGYALKYYHHPNKKHGMLKKIV